MPKWINHTLINHVLNTTQKNITRKSQNLRPYHPFGDEIGLICQDEIRVDKAWLQVGLFVNGKHHKAKLYR
jgi:hypothetical protein